MEYQISFAVSKDVTPGRNRITHMWSIHNSVIIIEYRTWLSFKFRYVHPYPIPSLFHLPNECRYKYIHSSYVEWGYGWRWGLAGWLQGLGRERRNHLETHLDPIREQITSIRKHIWSLEGWHGGWDTDMGRQMERWRDGAMWSFRNNFLIHPSEGQSDGTVIYK